MRTLLFAFFAFAVSGATAFADTITFTQTGVASGTIDNTSFLNAFFAITARGDTAQRGNPLGGIYFIDNITTSITINGVGSFSFLTRTRFWVDNVSGLVGFSGDGVNAYDLYDVMIDNPVFHTWDMRSSIGPLAGDGYLMQWSMMPILTNGGQLIFDDGPSPATFQANVDSVSEPSTFVLLSISAAAIAVVVIGSRRKK